MNGTDLLVLGVILAGATVYFKFDTWKELIFSNDDDISASQGGSNDIVQMMVDNDKNYLVLYASQTGTAEDYAKRFAKELKSKFALNVLCQDVENVNLENLHDLPSNIIVSFFVSTYGEGDFPDGAAMFEQFLSSAHLPNLNFTIFGLGNYTYEFFSMASEKTLKMLLEAGATLIGNLRSGDDGKGTTEEDYLAWKEQTLEALHDYINLSEASTGFKSSFKLSFVDEISNDTYLGELTSDYLPNHNSAPSTVDAKHPYVAPITQSKELFKSVGRYCIHSQFDISNTSIKYETGDHLAIWPFNANEKVDQFLSTFALQPDKIFDLESLDATMEPPFPCPTTIEAAVKYYLEITGPVSRECLSVLSEFAPVEIKEYVIQLSKDKDAFAKEITDKQFNLADALLYLSQGKPWSQVPWECLVEALTIITPRYYSISSSSNADPNSIHVTSIVECNTNKYTDSLTLGVTTNLLRNISLNINDPQSTKIMPVQYDIMGPRNLYGGNKLPIHIRHSTFKLPADPSVPIIMIGPGTGVAPFRGFVRDRVHSVETGKCNNMGKMMLFYGCRDENDFLYQNEWPEYSSKLDENFEMIVALSRVSDKKCYVQHKLKEYGQQVMALLNQGAHVYVCGDAGRMAKDVQHTICEMISQDKGISIDDANEMIKAIKVSGRYQEDIW
ncbi:NADPH--cytochrome P450 reductase [Monosporozyma servazzii]